MASDQNPYAPPSPDRSSTPASDRPQAAAPGEWVKWAYGAAAAVNAVSFVLIFLGLTRESGLQDSLIAFVDGPLRWGILALGMVWVYSAWSGLPAMFRRGVTPGSALVRLVIPIYSLYWLFGVNIELCRGLDTVLARNDDDRRAPLGLAMGATVLHLLPIAMLLTQAKTYAFGATIASNLLWFVYMLRCDPLRRAALRVLHDEDEDD